MYSVSVDRQRLHRLGRLLVDLSRQIEPHPGDVMPSPAEELVLGDVMLYPNSTIGDVVHRTGFTQGYVSKCVAGLVQRGLLVTAADEQDRRRTVIGPSPMLEGAAQRRTPPLSAVLASALGDPAEAAEVLAVLDDLADRLLD